MKKCLVPSDSKVVLSMSGYGLGSLYICANTLETYRYSFAKKPMKEATHKDVEEVHYTEPA